MRVYELMAELAKYPAAAEVEISGTISRQEIKEFECIDDDLFSYRFGTASVESGNINRVDIYAD